MTARKNGRTSPKRRISGKKRSSPKNTKVQQATPLYGEIACWIILAFCVILCLGNFGLGGKACRGLSAFFFGLFGIVAYAVPFVFFFLAALNIANFKNRRALAKSLYILGFLWSLCALLQLFAIRYEKGTALSSAYAYAAQEKKGGGLLGAIIVKILYPPFGEIAAAVILVVLLCIFLVLITNRRLLHDIQTLAMRAAAKGREKRQAEKEKRRERNPAEALPSPEEKRRTFSGITLQKKDAKPMRELSIHHAAPGNEGEGTEIPFVEDAAAESLGGPGKEGKSEKKVSAGEAKAAFATVSKEISAQESKNRALRGADRPYRLPPLSLLKKGGRKKQVMSDTALKETAAKLEHTLESFGVRATVTNVSCGPTVTQYELQPDEGVKVSRIVNLADDIKLNLAVADIRIVAPIPGKAAVGIEVPNTHNTAIMLRDLLESEEFQAHPSKIAFAVGMNIVGEIVVADIYKMPHLLIGGATGSGKSVCINTLIMSILYKASPDEVKFIMIDPKMIELNLYNGIPHLFIPVVTDPKKAAGALQWAVAEMTKRYRLFAELGVRDLKGYNAKVKAMEPPVLEETEEEAQEEAACEVLPQIVIVVDEFADLMMVASGEVEEAVCRLAQLARAAGIHLILATQRPSVDVITGLIKANMPSRIALAVSSGVDSRTIIDMIGAEKLLGKGDMLFYPQGVPKPVRVQGAFVSEAEVEAVCSFIRQKNGDAAYDTAIDEAVTSHANGCGKAAAAAFTSQEEDGRDEYFADAGRFIIEKEKASIGMLQRNFKIGFNRAARIMDALADAGVVGPEEGTKPRRILMGPADFEQYLASPQESAD